MNLMIVIPCGIIAAVSFVALLVCTSKYKDAQGRLISEATHIAQVATLLATLQLYGEGPVDVEDPQNLCVEADHQSARTSFWYKAMMATALIYIGSLIIGVFAGF